MMVPRRGNRNTVATEHIGVMESSWADTDDPSFLIGTCELSGFDLLASMDCTE
jgi:hypothetical protein